MRDIAIAAIDAIVNQSHLYRCLMNRLDLRIAPSEANFAYGSVSGVKTSRSKHFPNDLRAKIYVFGVSVSHRMGLAS